MMNLLNCLGVEVKDHSSGGSEIEHGISDKTNN